jgi:hypothetical protein
VANECRSLAREVTLVLAVAFGEGVELLPPAPDTSTSKPAGAPGPNAHDDRTTAGTTLEHGPLAPATPEAKAAKGAASRDAGTTTPTNAAATSASAAGNRQAHDHTGRARAALFLGGGLLFAALPSPASFVTAGGEFGTIRWWLAPRLSWLPRVDDTLARHVEARYEGLGGALAACAGFPTAAWIASACLGGGASALRGRSWGATESGEATAPWYTGSAAVALAWPARAAVSVRVEAALQLSLNEPRFVVEGLGDAHRVPRFAPSLAVTLVFTRATP